MDPLAVISPHLDDAVLSAGQLMAGRPDCVVITVFAGTPVGGACCTSYDRDSGFPNARTAMGTRRREDAKALRLLHARGVHLEYVDGQYDQPVDEADLAAALIEAVDATGAEVVLGPLGLAHPDHHRVRRAFADLLAQRRHYGWLYEDQPARVLWPELVADALAWWEGMGWNTSHGFLGTGPLEAKVRAVECYHSQLWALNMHAVLCPERHWELT